MKLLALAAGFFLIALLYSSVGFGGGSSYTAILAVSGVSLALVPVISLACNIAVVTGNSLRYFRRGLYDLSRIWPLIILSVPAAALGGAIPISERLFLGLLALSLSFAGLRLLFARARQEPETHRPQNRGLNAVIGGAIGFLSGLVGIGGGIFLAPILHALRWGSALQIAALCSLFILVNSLAGLAGQLTKLSGQGLAGQALSYWPLIIAVVLGGQIGNWLGVFRLPELWLKRATGILILAVAIRLAVKLLG